MATLLLDALPAGWTVDVVGALPAETDADFVVLFDPDVELIHDLTRSGVQVAALLNRRASSKEAIGAVDAGASICLRDHDPRLIGGYLVQRQSSSSGNRVRLSV